MPTAILRPSAVGTYNAWILGMGPSKEAAVDPGDPVVHDDDASYIRIGPGPGGVNNKQSFALDTGIPLTIESVSQLALKTQARSNGPAGIESYNHFVRLGGVNGGDVHTGPGTPYHAALYLDAPGTTYRTLTTRPFPRPGGGAWVPGDIVAGNLQHCLAVPSDSARTFRVTSAWAELEYVGPPPGGGYVAIIWSLLLPVMGAAAALHEVAQAAQLLARRSGVLLSEQDLREAWRELQAYGWPRTFDLAASSAKLNALSPRASMAIRRRSAISILRGTAAGSSMLAIPECGRLQLSC